ncbi:hypothetical protein JHK87_031528 [Glycine soja]|nr:hypothetical protein JHK87_031528 [Glycine soja]
MASDEQGDIYRCSPITIPLLGDEKVHQENGQVLFVCFLVCTIVYAVVAVLGYLMFGEDVESEVTLNLPRGQVLVGTISLTYQILLDD